MKRVRPVHVLWLAIGAWTVLFATLSLGRLHAFYAARFDVGNMVQAVWSTAQGRPLETTDVAGRQFVRLGAHVDPVLVLFTPLTWTGHLPEALLIAQSLIVALGALPAYWLARRYLGSERAGLVGAGVYLLYPPLQWAVLTEFHPVALAAPALMFCIWAIQEHRFITLIPFAVFAALTKEQVGLALAMLGIWCALRHSRRVGLIVAASGTAWTALCMLVIIPHFNDGRGSSFAGRYAHLGDGPHGVVATILTRPWEVVDAVATVDRLAYLAAVLVPLIFMPLAAPLVAMGALPDLAINLLSDAQPQRQVHYHYVAVMAPFLIAAAIMGFSGLRDRRPWRHIPPRTQAVVALVVPLACGVVVGPLPWWSAVPVVGSSERAGHYVVTDHARVAADAVAIVPEGVPVSASNTMGGHLSERRRIHIFPVIANAEWVVVDGLRPRMLTEHDPEGFARALERLEAGGRFELVFDRDQVRVYRRIGPG